MKSTLGFLFVMTLANIGYLSSSLFGLPIKSIILYQRFLIPLQGTRYLFINSMSYNFENAFSMFSFCVFLLLYFDIKDLALSTFLFVAVDNQILMKYSEITHASYVDDYFTFM
jgi:hypothetical protein